MAGQARAIAIERNEVCELSPGQLSEREVVELIRFLADDFDLETYPQTTGSAGASFTVFYFVPADVCNAVERILGGTPGLVLSEMHAGRLDADDYLDREEASEAGDEHPVDVAPDPESDTAPDGQEWQRVYDHQAFGEVSQTMRSVTSSETGLIAVGRDGRSAAVWISTDGHTWQRVAHNEQVFGSDVRLQMNSVTAGGPGLVAVGFDEGRGSSAAWVSINGKDWQRVEPDNAAFDSGGENQMLSVAAWESGLVAVGIEAGSAAVWTSPDGRTWQRVAHDEQVFGGEGIQLMRSVTPGGPGLVAVGRDRNSGAVWTSADGATWQRVAHDEQNLGGEGGIDISSVTDTEQGLVAVGVDEGRRSAAVWTSADGIEWQRVAHEEQIFGGDGVQRMSSVTAGGPGLVAGGGDGERAAIWTSTDGNAWQRAMHDDPTFGSEVGLFVSSVSAGGPGLVAVGYDSGHATAAVWTNR